MGYSYNNLDLITRVDREDGSARDYGYDELDQLASEEHCDASNAVTYAHTLGYDLAGNRTQTVRNAQTNVWALGQGNRLASWGPGTAAEYDAAGCTTSLVYAGGTRLDLTWNDRYQLLNVRKDGVEVESYTYDALGRRLSTSNAAGLVRHVYDGPHVIADVDSDGRPLRTYAYGPGIDNILSMTVHGATTNAYYYLKDHLGSVLALTDDAGDMVESCEYDAWGQASVYDASGAPRSASAFGNRYGFQGREQSWATGLIYFRARWYDAVTGRWLSNDPIGISGGLNQYVFCGNCPVNFTDAYGLFWKWGDGGWTIIGTIATITGGSLIVAASSPAWIVAGAILAVGGAVAVIVDAWAGWNAGLKLPQKTLDRWTAPDPSGAPTRGGLFKDSDGDGMPDAIDETPFPPAKPEY